MDRVQIKSCIVITNQNKILLYDYLEVNRNNQIFVTHIYLSPSKLVVKDYSNALPAKEVAF